MGRIHELYRRPAYIKRRRVIVVTAHPVNADADTVIVDDPLRIGIKARRGLRVSPGLILWPVEIDKAVAMHEVDGLVYPIGRCESGKTADTRAGPGMAARSIGLEKTIVVIAFMHVVHRRLEATRSIGVIKESRLFTIRSHRT